MKPGRVFISHTRDMALFPVGRPFGYQQTARAAGRHLQLRTSAGPSAITGAARVAAPDLRTWQQAVTWMETDRLNLHAAAGYAAQHGGLDGAGAIAAAMHGFLRSQGHWDQALALHRTALALARHAGDRAGEAEALSNLGSMLALTADYDAATASQEQALDLYRDLGNRLGEANARNDLGDIQRLTGDYPAATASISAALELYRGAPVTGG